MSGEDRMEARFGPAGNAIAFSRQYKSSLDAPAWIAGLGLDCYEYQCGKGVHVGQTTAEKLGERARQAGHRPCPSTPHISSACPTRTRRCGARRWAISPPAAWPPGGWGPPGWSSTPGALLKRTRRQALDIAKETLRQSIAACDDQGFGDVTLCPETMGKINQLGDLDEVLELCQIDGRLLPCIDFGHLYARSLGADDGAEVFARDAG